MPFRFLSQLGEICPPVEIFDDDDLENLWALAGAELVIATFPPANVQRSRYVYEGPATFHGVTARGRSLLGRCATNAQAKRVASDSERLE